MYGEPATPPSVTSSETHNDHAEAPRAPIPSSQDVTTSYDGSNVVFRLLRMGTWGPALMNLGYYPYHGLLSFLNLVTNQEKCQQQLVIKALELLDIKSGHRVLDVACGRGKSSFMVSCMFADVAVVGIDLLDRNIGVAQTLFDKKKNLSYRVGNAQSLDFPDQSFDRVLCVEAAFHFADRAAFLHESSRVLRPGGKLVVIDFAWNNDLDRNHRNDEETRLVRDIWQWEDLYSISEYHQVARRTGFDVIASQDWSRSVSHAIQGMFEFTSWLGNCGWGRRLLLRKSLLYRSISEAEWKDADRAAKAHRYVQRFTKYMALLFQKPH